MHIDTKQQCNSMRIGELHFKKALGFVHFTRRLSSYIGRAVPQEVSRWLPTGAARVRIRAECGVCGGQSGIRAGFLRVLRFPLPIIPPISPSS
jgi:hypothetical protein